MSHLHFMGFLERFAVYWILLLSLLAETSGYSVPADIYLGGIFQSYSYQNKSIVSKTSGFQHLAAFMLAVDEINSRSDVLPATRLRVVLNQGLRAEAVRNNSVYEGASAAIDIVASSPQKNLVAAVSTAVLQSTRAVVNTLDALVVPTLVAVPSICGENKIPRTGFNLQLHSLDAYLAAVIRSWLFWTDIGIFYETDTFGQISYSKFQRASEPFMNIHFAIAIPESTTDFSSYLRDAKRSGATVFLMFLKAGTMGALLEAGHRLKVFTSGTQVVGVCQEPRDQIWQAISSSADRVAIMRGFLTMVPAPELLFQTSRGAKLLSQLRGLAPTLSATLGNCSNRMDDSVVSSTHPSRSLYEVPSSLSPASSTSTCLGVSSYSQLFSNVSNIDANILFTYDAVMVAAKGVDEMIRQQLDISGKTLHEFLLTDVESIPSVTGNISFVESSEANDYIGRGQRTTGVMYLLQNFNEAAFQSGASSAFVSVGYFSEMAGGLFLCSDITASSEVQLPACQSIVYNIPGDGSQRPSGQLRNVVVEVISGYRLLFLVFAFVALAALLSHCWFLCRNCGEREVRNAQPKILGVMMLGVLCQAAWLFINVFPVSKYGCYIKFWTFNIMILAIFIPLQLKLWRIYRIVTSGLRRIRLTENMVMITLILVLLSSTGLVCFITIFGTIDVRYTSVQRGNQRILQPYCSPPSSGVGITLYYLLVGYEFLLLISAMSFLWLTRKVPAYVNEISVIGPIFGLGISVTALGLGVYFFAPIGYDNKALVLNCTVFFVVTWCTGRYIYDKRRRMIHRRQEKAELSPYLLGNRGSGGGVGTGPSRAVRTRVDEYGVAAAAGENVDPNAPVIWFHWDMIPVELAHGITEADAFQLERAEFVNRLLCTRDTIPLKARLCQDQMYLWASVLQKVQDIEEELRSFERRVQQMQRNDASNSDHSAHRRQSEHVSSIESQRQPQQMSQRTVQVPLEISSHDAVQHWNNDEEMEEPHSDDHLLSYEAGAGTGTGAQAGAGTRAESSAAVGYFA